MKRGQAEMIGLMLIMILLAIGLLLYLKFALEPDDGVNRRATYEASQMTQTFVNSLLQSDINCSRRVYSVRDLIKEIASGTAPTRCGTQSPEGLLNEYLNETLDATLMAWGLNYRLTIARPHADGRGEELIDETALPALTNKAYAPRECNDLYGPSPMMRQRPARGLIQTGTSTIEVRLEICG